MKYKLLFHISALLLIATEAYRIFLLSPIPGSQEVPAVETSYFLWHYRWIIRGILFAGMIIGARKVFEKRAWIPIITLLFAGTIFYMANFVMTAEAYFKTPETVAFAAPSDCGLPMDAIVLGFTHNGESKAYPIRYLAFHHQVPDVVGGQHVLVTYCDVCRSGAVYGEENKFRLVGMDQFNAILEDERSGSWWMQANGECIAGQHKGTRMWILPGEQLTLEAWSKKYPNGKVMLPDPKYAGQYSDEKFEKGTSTDELTRTDTASWQNKSWVVGIYWNGHARAYDWKQLRKQEVISDTLGGEEIYIEMNPDHVNFVAYKLIPLDDFQKKYGDSTLQPKHDTILSRQVFWHTWKTFYPNTTRYGQAE